MKCAARYLMVAVLLLSVACVAVADPLPGQELKFSQLPMIATGITGPDGTPQIYYGHDELSTVWWDPSSPVEKPVYHGTFMADDFADRCDRPVVHVKWWGSYLGEQTGRQVQRFAIVFENDIPSDQYYDFSHPDCWGQKHSQLSVRDQDGVLMPGEGTFTETLIAGSNPNEPVYEYNAELCCPFQQAPDTVYWLKIVALVDDSIEDPNRLEWGWHNRDYTIHDPLASVPNQVIPGEHIQGTLNAGTANPTEMWHFQDDAVSGGVWNVSVNDPCDVHMDQDHHVHTAPSMVPEKYVDLLDGPDGVSAYSKDLAFELYTIPEPSSLILLAMGMLVVATRRR